MKERLGKLLTVKSIVTLVLVAVFAYLAITGDITGQEFLTVFTVVISFYFGTQHQKNAGEPTTPTPAEAGTSPDKGRQGGGAEGSEGA